jgi:hypothetical protein
MNNNKETNKEQLNTNENQAQQQIHSLTHKEMMQYLYSTLVKKNPNVKMENKIDEDENIIQVTFLKKSPKDK